MARSPPRDGRRRLVSRTELFDEADLDAAIARFDELTPPARRLENAASHAYDRFLADFAARDWAGMRRSTPTIFPSTTAARW